VRWACSIFILGSVLTVAPGCGGGECGEGTVRHKNTCLPYDPFDKTPPVVTVDPPVRTRFVGNIRLITDEPAEIYVTTDDTPVTTDSTHEQDELVIPNSRNDIIVRYFAIDLAGNQSAEQTVLWAIDDQGPGPPSRFTLTLAGNTRNLSWLPPQNETHLGGVLVARVDSRLSVQPTSGTAYSVGDELEPGVTVVDVEGPTDTPTTFSESLPTPPGMVQYVAWGFDDLLNYGTPTGDFQTIAAPAQKGTLVINANGTVTTAGQPPPNVTLSGTAVVTPNGPTNDVTLKLTLRNDTTRPLFAPKLFLTTSLIAPVTWTDPTSTFAPDGTTTFPYRSYGAALLPGTANTQSWKFTGVNGALVLDLDVRDNRIMMVSQQTGRGGDGGGVVDFATGLEIKRLTAGPGGNRGGFGRLGGAITPDGRAVFGARSSGTLVSWDLATGNRLATSAELHPQKAHVPQLVLDRAGVVGYALVAEQHSRQAYSGNSSQPTELIRFDAATLTEHGRISIGLSRNRDLRISTDNRHLLVSTGLTTPGVIVVDLEKFEVIHNVVTSGNAQTAIFTPDGTQFVAVGSEIETFGITDGIRVKNIALPASGNRVQRAEFNGPDELWVGRRDNFQKIDLRDNPDPPQIFPQSGTRSFGVFEGKIYVGRGNLTRFDTNGNSELNFSVSARGHWLGRSPF